MKALKQKRISLRSLWRRGLVILSLFALVFASCSESDDGDEKEVSNSGKAVSSISFLSGPARPSYMGLPVDLVGVSFEVTYVNGDKEIFDDPRDFYVEPRIAYGYYNGLKFEPHKDYSLRFASGGKVYAENLEVEVVGIKRANADVTGVGGTGNQFILSGEGLQITGGSTVRSYYVDDTPNFSGLVCEANYDDGTMRQIPLSLENVAWDLYPDYDNMPNTGRGKLYITVGRHPLFKRDKGTGDDGSGWRQPELSNVNDGGTDTNTDKYNGLCPDSGVTAVVPIQQMFHVKAIEWDVEPEFEPYYYWQPDTDEAWYSRVAATGSKIKVTYSNGQSKPPFTMAELRAQNEVWFNQNPEGPDYGTVPDRDGDLVTPDKLPAYPFAVVGIQNSDTLDPKVQYRDHFKNKAPRIQVYYRGYFLDHKIPVLTRFVTFTAVSNTGEAIDVNMNRSSQDNDYYTGGRPSANVFAGLITVKATYQAFSDAEYTRDLPLSYNHEIARLYWDAADVGREPYTNSTGTRYTMNFGQNDTRWDPTGTLAASDYDTTTHCDMMNWGQCDNPQNNGRMRPVTVYYGVPPYVDRTGVTVSEGSNKQTRVNVNWSNIN